MTNKPSIFIASSSEQIQVANQIAAALQEPTEWDVKVWEEVFDFSATYVESLEAELERADFAVVVLTGDDWARVRSKGTILPRDNVIFELGLFIGRLGRQRCFFFVEAETRTQIASDLSGVKPVIYYPEVAAPSPSEPSLLVQGTRLKQQIRELGERGVRYKPTADDRRGQEDLWRFSSRAAGYWWERMREGDDDLSALSYIRMTVNPATNTPFLSGKGFTRDGMARGAWRSITTGVVYGDKPQINYRWEGEDSVGDISGGIGVMTFEDDRLKLAEGSFFDTNFAQLRDGAPPRARCFRLFRCDADDVDKMQQGFSNEALIKERLESLRWPKA